MNKQNTVTTETFNLSVATLHILAMTLMLMDHGQPCFQRRSG